MCGHSRIPSLLIVAALAVGLSPSQPDVDTMLVGQKSAAGGVRGGPATILGHPELPFSNRLGGGRDEAVEAIVTDAAGNVYITGWTSSPDLEVSGGFQADYGGKDCQYFTQKPCGDAFVAKYDSAWRLIYSTFLGGSGSDAGMDLDLDEAGNVYVAGRTDSDLFPGTGPRPPGRRRGENADSDVFVVKLNPEGTAIVYSRVLGGVGNDYANAVAVDREGSAYVVGSTDSPNFPTAAPFQPAPGGGTCTGPAPKFAAAACSDAFVTKLAPNGASLAYSTYLGRSKGESGNDIAVDDAGHAYITGETSSADFPVLAAARGEMGKGDCPLPGQDIEPQLEGPKPEVLTEPCTDAFVAKLASTGSALTYSTFLGGKSSDSGNAIAIDEAGNAVVAGKTLSSDFPTARPFQRRFGGGVCGRVGEWEGKPLMEVPCADGFVTRFDLRGSGLTYSTFLGKAEDEEANAVALDSSGGIYIAGRAEGSFPVKKAIQPKLNLHTDSFVARFDPALSPASSLTWSTYLGGSGREVANAVALGHSGAALVAGQTDSRSDFPTAPPSQGLVEGGQRDGFVAKLVPSRPRSPLITSVRPRGGPIAGGTRVEIRGEGLSEADSVRFGRRPAEDLDASEDGSRITVTAPSHRKGRVPVAVVSSDNSSGPLPGASYTFGDGGWRSIPGPHVFHHASAPLPNGRILVTGGCTKIDAAGRCIGKETRRASIFDPLDDRWTPAAPMSIPRIGHTATLLQGPKEICGDNCGKVLVAGNVRGHCSELYDPKTNKWSPTATAPERTPGVPYRLPNYREAGAPFDQPVCSDLDSSYANKTAILLPIGPPAICGKRCGNVLLIDLGFGPGVYDPKTNMWPSPAADGGSGPGSPDSGGVSRSQFEAPDERSGSRRRYSEQTATLLPSGLVLLIGGISYSIDSTADTGAEEAQIYDPVYDTRTTIPGPSVLRYGGHTATLLPNGRVLVAGGMTDNVGTLTSSAELFEPPVEPRVPLEGGVRVVDPVGPVQLPRQGSWKPTGSMAVGRFGHSAVALPSGRVLVAGGADVTGDPNSIRDNFGSAVPTTEVYDPSIGRWAEEGALNAGRNPIVTFHSNATTTIRPTSTLNALNDGRMLLVGGDPEIYTPSDYKPDGRERWSLPYSPAIWGIGLVSALAFVALFIVRRRR